MYAVTSAFVARLALYKNVGYPKTFIDIVMESLNVEVFFE